jgi:ABC-type branched-subunit amino acid transport system permease subunit
MLDLAINGIPVGGMYALAALGIVLIYRTTGTLNLAQGAVATSTAFVFYELWAVRGVPLPVSLMIALAVAAAIGVGIERIMRKIGPQQILSQVIATLGISGVLLWSLARLFGTETRFVEPFFSSRLIRIGGVNISVNQLAIIGVAGVIAVVSGLILTRTKIGTAIRATSQNRLAADLAGVPVHRLQTLSWMWGSVLAGIAGILLAPLLFLDTLQVSVFFLVKPFAAAVVGGLVSFPVAFGAGIAIGVAESVLTRYSGAVGLPEMVPFGIVLVALLARKGFLASTTQSLGTQPMRRGGSMRGGIVAGIVVVAIVPFLRAYQTTILELGIIFALLALSLVVLTGWVGQVSLAQAAFFGMGGFVASNLANRADLPFPLVVILTPLALVPFAAVVGLPALRLRGLLLAIMTLAFGVLAYNTLFQWNTFTGGLDGSILPAPTLFGADLTEGHRYVYFLLGLAALVFFAVRNLGRFRAGGALFSVRDSEEGAASLGVSTTMQKLTAFSISGAIAGLAGCLSAYQLQAVAINQYHPLISFNLLALAVIGGIESLWGAAIAGGMYALSPQLLGPLKIQDGVQIVSAVGLVLTLLVSPSGLAGLGSRFRFAFRRRAATRLVTATMLSRPR